jgi:hypothetical protein
MVAAVVYIVVCNDNISKWSGYKEHKLYDEDSSLTVYDIWIFLRYEIRPLIEVFDKQLKLIVDELTKYIL